MKYTAFTVIILFMGLALLASCNSDDSPTQTEGIYLLSTNVSPEGAGTIEPESGEFDEGDEVQLVATPEDGWLFDGWQGDASGSTDTLTVKMDGDREITALFEERGYPLTLGIEGEGNVSEEVIEESESDDGLGTVVELTAEPEDDWEFIGWGGDVDESSNPLTLTVDEEMFVVAIFQKVTYDLNVTIDGEGSVDEEIVTARSNYEEGTTVELTARPEEGWVFTEWKEDLSGSENPETLTMDEPKEVTAVFEQREYPLTLTIEGEGTVEEEVIQAKTTDYESGEEVQLTANPSSNWGFVEWQGDLSGSENPQNIVMDGEREVTVIFEQTEFSIEVDTDGGGSVEFSPDKDLFEKDEEVELTAVARDGWFFAEWGVDLIEFDNPETLVMTRDRQVEATFLRVDDYLLRSVTGQGTVEYEQKPADENPGRDELILTAEPADGWQFVEWGGDLSGSDPEQEYSVWFNSDVEAVFERKEFKISTTVEGEGKIEFEPDRDQYEFQSEVEVTAVADEGWRFDRWEGDLSGSNPNNELVVNENKTIEAHFTPSFYRAENGVTIKCDDASIGESGEVDGVEYTKRERVDITPDNASTTCTSGIADMSNLFRDEASFNEDISHWDISSVESMSFTFRDAAEFNRDISKWDVSNVTEMNSMFRSAASFNQDLGDWDVNSVTNMRGMFNFANSFNQDIGGWDVSNVTDMSFMFSDAKAFNQDIGEWDVSSVEQMEAMFSGTDSFNQDIGAWDVSNVTDMSFMFNVANSFNQDIGGWDVSSVKAMNRMFQSANLFNQDIGGWDVSSVTEMDGMFNLTNSFNQDIGDWDVSNVTNMDEMFNDASTFNRDLTGWCVDQFEFPPSGFSTGSVLENENEPIWGECPSDAFQLSSNGVTINCTDADVGDIGIINGDVYTKRNSDDISPDNAATTCTSGIKDMSELFEDDATFNEDISHWDVSSVTTMRSMFKGATIFNSDIGDWDVSNVEFLNGMFDSAELFDQDIGRWDVGSVRGMQGIFAYAKNFNQDIGGWDVSNVGSMVGVFFSAESFNQDLTGWCVEDIEEEPDAFATGGAALEEANKPNWGATCQ